MHQDPASRHLCHSGPLSRAASLLLAAGLGALLVSCGGDGGGNAPAIATPPDASPPSSSTAPDAGSAPPERASCAVMNGQSCQPGSNPSCRDELMNFVCGCNETDGGARGWLCLPFCGNGPCPAASPIQDLLRRRPGQGGGLLLSGRGLALGLRPLK